MDAATDTTWSLEAVRELKELAAERVPLTVMSLKLKRPVDAVRAKLTELGITPAAEL